MTALLLLLPSNDRAVRAHGVGGMGGCRGGGKVQGQSKIDKWMK